MPSPCSSFSFYRSVLYVLRYLEADFPRLIVRTEDFLFHAQEVMDAINTCVGFETKSFKYELQAVKKKGTDFVAAMTKHGTTKNRALQMYAEDLDYARSVLNPELLEMLQYPSVPASSEAGCREFPCSRK